MEIGDFVRVPSKTVGRIDIGVIGDIIHNDDVVYYEVIFFDGDSEMFLPDRVERINEER